MKNQRSIVIKNELSEMTVVQEKLNQYYDFHNFSENVRFAIDLAMDEIITNIISYAFEPGTSHPIYIDLDIKDNYLIILIKDDGVPFNPLEAKEPDFDIPLSDRTIGGLGIFLTKKNMDEVHYEFNKPYNCLTLKKKIN